MWAAIAPKRPLKEMPGQEIESLPYWCHDAWSSISAEFISRGERENWSKQWTFLHSAFFIERVEVKGRQPALENSGICQGFLWERDLCCVSSFGAHGFSHMFSLAVLQSKINLNHWSLSSNNTTTVNYKERICYKTMLMEHTIVYIFPSSKIWF